jgi:hypothetical protein
MANENQVFDLASIIKDLMARRAALDAAITNLQAASGAVITAPDGTMGTPLLSSAGADSQPTELPRGAFLNKSLPAAVKLYLSSVVKKQTIKEIATALREGGVESTSDNFEGVITGCLHRMKSNGELLQFKDGWALAERYPAHIRASLSHGGASARKVTKKKGKKSSKAAKPAKDTPDIPKKIVSAPMQATKLGLEQRIEEFVRSRKGHSFGAADILNANPDIERRSLPLALGRLAKKHLWIKEQDGKYRESE